MTIEEIKFRIKEWPELCGDSIGESLLLTIDYLEDAAKHYNVQEGQRAIACLKAIENKFQ